MNEISAIGVDFTNFDTIESLHEENLEAIERTAPEEGRVTLDQMIHEGALYRTTSPNIRKMEQIEKLKKALELNLPYNEEFSLQKELFGMLFQDYKDSGGDIRELRVTIKGLLNVKKEDREEYLVNSSNLHKELVGSYLKLFELADKLSSAAVIYQGIPCLWCNAEEGAKIISEPYKPYFLEILELEESLGCEIQGQALISTQVYSINVMLQILGPFMNGFDLRQPLAFYWDILVPSYHRCLTMLDQRGDFESFLDEKTGPKEGLFYIIFGAEVTKFYRARNAGDDPILKYYPLVMKYGDIDIMKARFYQSKSGLKEWERDFQWIEFLKGGSEYIAQVDQIKSEEYLDRIVEIEKGFVEKYVTKPSFHISSELPNPFELFLPYLIKYGQIEDGRQRFDALHKQLTEWERDLQWIQFLKDSSVYIAEADFKKSQEYLDRIIEIEKGFVEKYITKPSSLISSQLPNPFELFFPYLIKYGQIEDARQRFDALHKTSAEWDKAFEWVSLYIKGARLLKEANPERSQALLIQAKQLVKDTLTPSYFSWSHNSWKEKETEALRLIQEVE